MVHKSPLQVDSKEQLQEIKCSLTAAFSGSIHSGKQDIDVSIPDVVCQEKARSRSKGGKNKVGPVSLFRHGSPFAIIHLWADREVDEYGYSLGGHANWQRRGSEAILMEYFEAVEVVLEHLEVLPNHYRVSCPCGAEKVIDGRYTAIIEFFASHNNSGVHEGERVSTSTLVGRDISIETKTEQNTECQEKSSPRV
jgi:hypothetical protein